ncbi:MAG: ATP-binding protein [Dehalococcoidales bacterium]|nr:ATP-binding protein [Dehalococcoidales bacterium]
MSYEISLESMLNNKNPELSGRLPKIREEVEPLMSYTQGKFPFYTPHNFNHSLNVEENLNWLVPDDVKEKMNEYEIFFLIVSAWIHDWGMVAEDGESNEDIREEHHVRTEQKLEKYYDKVFLSEHEARIIGKICKGHRKVDLHDIEFDDLVFRQGINIRVKFLGALLRIADECDVTHNRTPEVIYFSINPTGKSEQEFKKHLSITGVGQREEKHKIYISAIARDPKGAKALREVESKIQNELNGIKNILAANEISLDIVELQLETRGFIDQPIGFEINKNKIVNLLIGDHLYQYKDVAIRELIQNAIDTCQLRKSQEYGYEGEIIVTLLNDELIVTDNGLGMNFSEAKAFLSSIGDSIYNLEIAEKVHNESDYSPISKFGIGILSCFLIADGVQIETYKLNSEPCRFTILSVNEEWKYEKGSRKEPGTTITLHLNSDGQKIVLEESIYRYFLTPEIKIKYSSEADKVCEFQPIWDGKTIFDRFVQIDDYYKHRQDIRKYEELLSWKGESYDAIVSKYNYSRGKNTVLFNHGIYVGETHTFGLDYNIYLYINITDDIIDISLSRESVKENDKYRKFMYSLFNDMFHEIYKRNKKDNYTAIISLIDSINNGTTTIWDENVNESYWDNYPYVKSFFENAPIIRIIDGKPILKKWSNIEAYNYIQIFTPYSLEDDIDFIKNHSNLKDVYINPLNLIEIYVKGSEYKNLLTFILDEKGFNYQLLDTRKLLLDVLIENDFIIPEIMPINITFASFNDDIKPLVVLKNPAELSSSVVGINDSLYILNFVVWKTLLDNEEFSEFTTSVAGIATVDEIDKIEIIKDYHAYIDCNDDFVKQIIEIRKNNGEFLEPVLGFIRRYFVYLSLLPIAIYGLESSIFIIDAINSLETDISRELGIKKPKWVFGRMKPSSKLYMKYYIENMNDYVYSNS